MSERSDDNDRPDDGSHRDSPNRREDLRWAAVGGVAAGIVGFVGMVIVGTASAFEARRLLDAVLPTVRFAASAYIAGGATILALIAFNERIEWLRARRAVATRIPSSI